MKPLALDLTGKRFGRLIVLKFISFHKFPCGQSKRVWKCRCDCGNNKNILASSLSRGQTKSCGCLQIEAIKKTSTKHGLSHKRIWRTWHSMIERCEYSYNKSFEGYGAKGIKVCKEWHNPSVFFKWAFSNGYKDNLTIDRIDSKKGYEPNNCQWLTMSENVAKRNREHSKCGL
jgi:hypothetical protein